MGVPRGPTVPSTELQVATLGPTPHPMAVPLLPFEGLGSEASPGWEGLAASLSWGPQALTRQQAFLVRECQNMASPPLCTQSLFPGSPRSPLPGWALDRCPRTGGHPPSCSPAAQASCPASRAWGPCLCSDDPHGDPSLAQAAQPRGPRYSHASSPTPPSVHLHAALECSPPERQKQAACELAQTTRHVRPNLPDGFSILPAGSRKEAEAAQSHRTGSAAAQKVAKQVGSEPT